MTVFFDLWRCFFFCSWLFVILLSMVHTALLHLSTPFWLTPVAALRDGALLTAVGVTSVGILAIIGLIVWKTYKRIRSR